MHYHIKHKKSDEEYFVHNLNGYIKEDWKITKLDRVPDHHEKLIDNKLVTDQSTFDRSEAESRYRMIDKGNLMLLIEKIQGQLLSVLEENSILKEFINKLSAKVAKLERGIKQNEFH